MGPGRGARRLAGGYLLAREEPGLLVLRRPDGSFIAAFDEGRVGPEAVEEAAGEFLSWRPSEGEETEDRADGGP
jgi:hypothetical protein